MAKKLETQFVADWYQSIGSLAYREAQKSGNPVTITVVGQYADAINKSLENGDLQAAQTYSKALVEKAYDAGYHTFPGNPGEPPIDLKNDRSLRHLLDTPIDELLVDSKQTISQQTSSPQQTVSTDNSQNTQPGTPPANVDQPGSSANGLGGFELNNKTAAALAALLVAGISMMSGKKFGDSIGWMIFAAIVGFFGVNYLKSEGIMKDTDGAPVPKVEQVQPLPQNLTPPQEVVGDPRAPAVFSETGPHTAHLTYRASPG